MKIVTLFDRFQAGIMIGSRSIMCSFLDINFWRLPTLFPAYER